MGENKMHPDVGLAITGCVKSYGPIRALDRVSMTVPQGRIVGLVGPNGAGKTTLLHALMGLVRLDQGSMTLDGEPVDRVVVKRRMAFMPDDLPRPSRLTGREFVEFTCRLYGAACRGIEELAARLELDGRFDQRLGSYSHGMRRKVDLMAAVLVIPGILVMDEPFSGLDPSTVAVVQELLTELSGGGVGILLSSHDLELVEEIADDLVMIDHGRVVFRGSTRDLVASSESADVRSAFLALADWESKDA